MIYLGSTTVFPLQDAFVTCSALEIIVYGSDEGGGQPTVCFEFSQTVIWKRRGDIINTLENVSSPRSFAFHRGFPTQLNDLHSWLDSMFPKTTLFNETRDLIRREVPSFGFEVARIAHAKGFARLEFKMMAVEVVNLSYYGEPEQSIEEDDDNCEEDDDSCEEEDDSSEDDSSEDDEESGMVPAASSSIDSLKTTQVGAKKLKEICTVCLDQFSVGAKVAQMPCAHTFHRDCIVSWLERSHICPLCRFEMPI